MVTAMKKIAVEYYINGASDIFEYDMLFVHEASYTMTMEKLCLVLYKKTSQSREREREREKKNEI